MKKEQIELSISSFPLGKDIGAVFNAPDITPIFPLPREEKELAAKCKRIETGLQDADFGYAERPWLIVAGHMHLDAKTIEQIEFRAAVLPLFLRLSQEILTEEHGGNPLSLWGHKAKYQNPHVAMVRLDDFVTPEGIVLASEVDGWPAGEGQISILRVFNDMEWDGNRSHYDRFDGIDNATVKFFTQTYGKDAKIRILIPNYPEEAWKFTALDFELLAKLCQQQGLDLRVERPPLQCTANKIKGKYGDIDVLWTYFPPTAFFDPNVVPDGQKILKAWQNADISLFPEPNWLSSKLICTIPFVPKYRKQLTKKLFHIYGNWPEVNKILQVFTNNLFPWSWPLDPKCPPVTPDGKVWTWDKFLEWQNLYLGHYVLKPLLGNECSGLHFTNDKTAGFFDPEQFARDKLAQWVDEPFPTQPGNIFTSVKQSAEIGWDLGYGIDYRRYMIQKEIPQRTCSAVYMNGNGTGVRRSNKLNARLCTTLFVNEAGLVLGDTDVTLRENKKVHGATNSAVTTAVFDYQQT